VFVCLLQGKLYWLSKSDGERKGSLGCHHRECLKDCGDSGYDTDWEVFELTGAAVRFAAATTLRG
jgi:hypothetical protein